MLGFHLRFPTLQLHLFSQESTLHQHANHVIKGKRLEQLNYVMVAINRIMMQAGIRIMLLQISQQYASNVIQRMAGRRQLLTIL